MHGVVNLIMFFLWMDATRASKEMSNKHFRVAAYEWWPYLSLDSESPDGTVEVSGGVLLNLINFMQGARNFTYTIVPEPNGIWGNCVGKDNCTGMIGMVLRDEVDFALGNVS